MPRILYRQFPPHFSVNPHLLYIGAETIQSGRAMIVAFSLDVPLLVNWPLVSTSLPSEKKKKKKSLPSFNQDYKMEKKNHSKKNLLNVQECPEFFLFLFCFCFFYCVGNRGCLAGDGKRRSRFVELRLLLIGSVL